MTSPGIQHDFLDPPKDSEDHLGTLGHYRVLRELGKGGMGYVFLAEDTRLKREVALKVMNKKIASTPGSRKRFISEARAMAAVHHDNVATIFEVGEHKGTPFMAMELLQGATLENYQQRHGKPDYHQIIAYARDIARGLDAAHRQGIVHRDIKPANIWLDTKTNRIKILDFGLALASTPVDQLSGRGAVVGTPGYLSPEQARSEPLDDRSDLYSAGVVLYEMATGKLPLKSKTVAEQLIAILAHAPKPLIERNREIPQPLADLIHRLMAKEPRDRYASAADLEKALDEVEVECEKKSEVAQAISQLQLGLEQAVSKKNLGGSDGGDWGISEEAPPNPFETLPDVLPAATPLAGDVGSSGAHPAVAVPQAAPGQGSMGSGTFAAAKSQRKPAPEPAAASNSKIIWITVGVVAVLLLVLIPTIVYISDSSAIARQQQEEAVYVAAAPAANPTPSSSSNTPRQAPRPKPPEQQSGTPKQPTPPAQPPSPPATKVDAKEVKGVGGPGYKWLLSHTKNNGSFEQGDPASGPLRLQGWTAALSGKDGGWNRNPNARNEEAKTYAYAGPNSELVLVSDAFDYKTKAGDAFRISVNTGGQGPGETAYRVVLGFNDKSGPPIRYQLAEFSSNENWTGGKQKKSIFEYTVDAAVEGKSPYVEFVISNKASKRKRGMLDRVVVTVRNQPNVATTPSSPPPGEKPSLATPAEKPSPDPAMAKSSPTDPPSPTETAPKPAPPPESPSLRIVALKTSDDNGADATVKRGGGFNDPQGEKPVLYVQTRSGIQVQHIYARFWIQTLRADQGGAQAGNRNRGGNNKLDPLPVETAELSLTLAGTKRDPDASIRVYGFSDPISDVWPENRIVWGNSLSEKGLEKLPLLAEQKVGRNNDKLLISSDALAKFVAQAGHRSVTLILTGSVGDELVTFASREDESSEPPTLILGLRQ
ncbi:Serine/threonine-protein kinase Pkn1 [Stieleria maiorica]|uniref:Serine/threonine-protein kinase Pkn1 n=1 Tax=Stieleria maiorica TaxID=2795974 RepID=A0A5B9MFU1_9BACT|nr:serine/threonine-protein kinase [Stieleria maiorica]QEG00029.1 Serine/threonine-protein kinase Pkn1 [Stieleria maiorica]